jgi:Right handed beta helix region/Inverse autotransporter, beta-domain
MRRTATVLFLLLTASPLFAARLPEPFSALERPRPQPAAPQPCSQPCAESCPEPCSPCEPCGLSECVVTPYWEFDGKFFDFRRGGGGLFFTPAWQCGDKLLFFQGHGGYYRDFLYSGSLGLGFREQLFPYVGLGLNVFFDANRSDKRKTYLQGGVGAELFGPWWLARINGYIPTLKSSFLNLQPLVFGNEIAIGGLQEKSYGGVDMEAGIACPTVHGELWGFAGMYYFDACHVKPIVGPRLRAEWRLYDFGCCPGTQVTIGGQFSYDHLHRAEAELLIRVRVPFGIGHRKEKCATHSRFCRRMADPVYRQSNIWVERGIARARASEGGRPLATIWFVSAGAGGKGSQDKPASVAQVNAVSEPGDIIFLLPYNGPIRGPTLELKADQRLLSFGAASEVGILLPFQESVVIHRQRGLPGIHSTLLPHGEIVGVHAAPDVDIQGIRVDGGSIGILADQGGAISIRDVILSNQSKEALVARDGDIFEMSDSYVHSGPQGVRVSNYLVSDISGNQFSQLSGNALWFEKSRLASSVHVADNDFSMVGNSVHISGPAPARLAFENNRLFASGGLSYASRGGPTPSLLVDGNRFKEIPHGLTAASIQGDPVHLTLINNTIVGSPDAHAGFLVSTETNRTLIRDNFIDGIGGHAIDIRNELTEPSQNITLLVEGNTILNTGGSAFCYIDSRLAAGHAHLTLIRNQISDTGAPAIDIDTMDGAKDRVGVTLLDNQIAAHTGLHVHAANGPIIDLWPSNDPSEISNIHNAVDGKIELEGVVGQLAQSVPRP